MHQCEIYRERTQSLVHKNAQNMYSEYKSTVKVQKYVFHRSVFNVSLF